MIHKVQQVKNTITVHRVIIYTDNKPTHTTQIKIIQEFSRQLLFSITLKP